MTETVFNPYHNFETMPDGNLRLFDPRICCVHSWIYVGPYVDERDDDDDVDDDSEVISEYSCACGAYCLRDPKTLALVAYDNAQHTDMGRGG